MIGRTVRVGVAVFVGLCVVVGCSSSNRPNEVLMDRAKPCELISRAELRGMDVKAKPQPSSVVEGINMEGKTCRYYKLNNESIVISTVTNQGADWMGGSKKSDKAKEVRKTLGFRTIREESKDSSNGPHDTCTLWLDVASDQSLKVEVGENQKEDPPTCDTAHKFAEAAMKTLVK